MKERRALIPLLRWLQQYPGTTVSRIGKDIQALPWEDRLRGDVPSANGVKWRLLYLEALGYVYEDSRRWYPAIDLNEKLEKLELEEKEAMRSLHEGPRPSDHIDCLVLTARVSSRLEKQGIRSVSDLRDRLEAGNLDRTGLGKKSMEEIERQLEWHTEKTEKQP